ncbi:hypothetical protein JJD41_03295 [Oxynema sp. CENA135]|nr:hypothetical protein [Oxynema sp. CENA135]
MMLNSDGRSLQRSDLGQNVASLLGKLTPRDRPSSEKLPNFFVISALARFVSNNRS